MKSDSTNRAIRSFRTNIHSGNFEEIKEEESLNSSNEEQSPSDEIIRRGIISQGHRGNT